MTIRLICAIASFFLCLYSSSQERERVEACEKSCMQECADSMLWSKWKDFPFSSETAFMDARDLFDDSAEEIQTVCCGKLERFVEWLLDSSAGNISLYDCLREKLEEAFYSPRGVRPSDEIYLVCLDKFLYSNNLDEADRERYSYQRSKLMLNRPGTKAADLRLKGEQGWVSLAETVAAIGADSIYVVFYDPDCESCLETIKNIAADHSVAHGIQNGSVAVVAINIEPRNKYLPSMPKEWLSLIDKKRNIMKGKQYYIRTVPKVYLLSNNMTVIKRNIKSFSIQ